MVNLLFMMVENSGHFTLEQREHHTMPYVFCTIHGILVPLRSIAVVPVTSYHAVHSGLVV